MADLDFEIKGTRGYISAFTFERAVGSAVGLLREFDSAISGKPNGTLRWYISRLHSNGNLLITFQSKIKPTKRRHKVQDVSNAVAGSLLSGLDILENKCETPAYLSVSGLRRADSLSSLIGKNGATGFRFTDPNGAVDVTIKTSENVQKLLPVKRTSIGSVEGKLEAVNIHKKHKVIIYHRLTNKAITCHFDPGKLEHIKTLLGHSVVAVGELQKNVNGDTLYLQMERVELAETFKSRITNSALCASGVPEFAIASSTQQYMRRIRGG